METNQLLHQNFTLAKDHSNLENSLDNSSSESFAQKLQSHIKILSKNRALSKTHKDFSCEGENQITEDTLTKLNTLFNSSQKSLKNFTEDFSLDKQSCLTAFIVTGKSLRNMISDFELLHNSELFKLHDLSDSLPNEDYFNLARIKYYSGETSVASFLLSRIPSNEIYLDTYKLWNLMISFQITHFVHSGESRKEFVCCGNREKLSRKRIEKGIALKFCKFDYSIEALWGLLEISLSGCLEIGVDIDPSKHYAAHIKKISQYYGYLAWAKISLQENVHNGTRILNSIIQKFKSKPEAYFMLWEIYYKKKEYGLAKSLIEKAYFCIDKNKDLEYYVLFSLKLAKITYTLGSFEECLRILYKNYLEHPDFTVFLYHICKYCIQSGKQETFGMAIGVLKELTRISDSTRIGCLYYWISKGYQSVSNHFKTYIYASKASNFLRILEKSKNLEIKKIIYDLRKNIEKISIVQNHLNNKTTEYIDEIMLDQIKQFSKPIGDILHSDYLVASGKPDLALDLVKNLTDLDQIYMGAYLRVFNLEKPVLVHEFYKKLVRKSVDPNTPIQECIKSCLIYSKFLFRAGNHSKSLYILRSLAKALPKNAETNLPYCRALQNAMTEEELAAAYLKIGAKKNQEYQHFKLRQLFRSFVKIDFSSSDSSGGENKKSIFVSQADFIDENLENSLFELTISSKPKFLMLIAKLLHSLGTQKQEAILAIDDYIELLKFKKTKSEEKLHKALNLKIKLNV